MMAVVSSSPCKTVLVCLALFTLAGCAAPQTRMPTVDSVSMQEEVRKQQELVVEEYMSSYRRLQAVSSRIVTSGTELCGDKVAPYYGLTVWNRDDFGKAWQEVLQSRFGIAEAPSISTIAPGSQAEQAGAREGDVIVSVNGWLAPKGKDAVAVLTDKLSAEGKFGTPVELVVQRGAEEVKLSLQPGHACDFRVRLSPDDVKNAYADGKNIVVYKGMMDFARSDEEIALVVSHELAHNAMKHIDAQKTNATIGGVLGLLVDVAAALGGVNTNGDFMRLGSNMGAGAYSVDFEKEADYVGLYFMALAGYNIDGAAGFWRRMATIDSRAITMKSSHPTTPERFLAIETTVDEIKQKIRSGVALKPEFKGRQQAATEPVQAIPH